MGSSMFVLKISAVKPCGAIGGKEEEETEPALIVVTGINTQRSLPTSLLRKIYIIIFWRNEV